MHENVASENIEVAQLRHRTAPVRRGFGGRRLRAILAGGLVLGIGAAVTLAAWNDSEFATGTFSAGTFNLLGSTNGTVWTDHPLAGSAATLPFTLAPTQMAPGDVVYAPFAIELDQSTTNSGTVTISAPSTTGVVTNLTYTLIQPAAFGCAAGTTGTTLVTAGTAVGTVAGTLTFSLVKGTPPTTAGAPAFLCFIVTAGAGILQGQTGTATWQFSAASI
jgi:predicted ribosomally synthesized peptide with SipW-like signal peptide